MLLEKHAGLISSLTGKDYKNDVRAYRQNLRDANSTEKLVSNSASRAGKLLRAAEAARNAGDTVRENRARNLMSRASDKTEKLVKGSSEKWDKFRSSKASVQESFRKAKLGRNIGRGVGAAAVLGGGVLLTRHLLKKKDA